MNALDAFMRSMRENLECLLGDRVSGEEFVRRYNNLMADELPDELERSGAIYRLLDDYHTEFNLYVENPKLRAHSDHYYGPDELKRKAMSLLDQLSREEGKSRS